MISDQVLEFRLQLGLVDFGSTVVEFKPISIDRDSFPALVLSRNGSGKSTFINLISQVIPNVVDADKAFIDGFIRTENCRFTLGQKNSIASIIPQNWDYGLLGYDWKSEMAIGHRGSSPWSQFISGILELEQFSGRPSSVLSDGEKKRLLIATSVSLHRPLLMSDEIDMHLDKNWSMRVQSVMSKYFEEGGVHIDLNHTRKDGSGYSVHELCYERIATEDDEAYSRHGVSQNGWDHSLQRIVEISEAIWSTCQQPQGRFQKVIQLPYRLDRKVQIDIGPGEITELIGDNGSGKTTLLHELFRSERRIFSGFRRRNSKRCNLLLVPADPTFFILGPTVSEEIYRAMGGCSHEECEELIGLSEILLRTERDTDVLSLSVATKKLLSILVAVLSGYSILAFDEPLSGLDRDYRKAAVTLIRKCSQHGKAVLTTSHAEDELMPDHLIEL